MSCQRCTLILLGTNERRKTYPSTHTAAARCFAKRNTDNFQDVLLEGFPEKAEDPVLLEWQSLRCLNLRQRAVTQFGIVFNVFFGINFCLCFALIWNDILFVDIRASATAVIVDGDGVVVVVACGFHWLSPGSRVIVSPRGLCVTGRSVAAATEARSIFIAFHISFIVSYGEKEVTSLLSSERLTRWSSRHI